MNPSHVFSSEQLKPDTRPSVPHIRINDDSNESEQFKESSDVERSLLDESIDQSFQPQRRTSTRNWWNSVWAITRSSPQYAPVVSNIELSDHAFSVNGAFSTPRSENTWIKRFKLCSLLIVSIAIGYLLHPLLESRHTEKKPFLPDWGTTGHIGEGLAKYPTDFTRDVLPIPCHSHNDYWRRVPLFEALHYGMISVEADVWLLDGELYVGHDTASLTVNRTFRNLYINPIYHILEGQNPSTQFSNTTKQGVFDEDPSQTLVLLVDFKTSGKETLRYVEKQLGALRSKDYLTYFDGEKVVPGPVTVVGTGNTPFDDLISNTGYRDIFFDAPLDLMELESSAKYNRENSYYASTSLTHAIGHIWRGYLTEKQLATIRAQIAGAKKLGLVPRYWDTPGWPVWLRNHVWQVLLREGVGMLNVDDLESAARKDWRAERKWFGVSMLGK